MGTSMRYAPGRSARKRPWSTELGPLGDPLFILNLKAYPKYLGPGAERIGRNLQAAGRAHRVRVAIAAAAPDLGRLSRHLSIPVLAQHTDPDDAGARTGATVAEALANAKVRGSLVNHSERLVPTATIGRVVERLTSLGLVPVVCAADPSTARRLAAFRPAYLAVEPPALIGGDRSVSKARPDVITRTVHAVRAVSPTTIVLCGAGIHDRHDVSAALALGAHGILVASAVTRAARPVRAIEELMAGFPPAAGRPGTG